jgi:hypothetical protein
LVNYYGSHFPNEALLSSSEEEGTIDKDGERIARLERDEWVALHRMLDLLTQTNPGIRIPIPPPADNEGQWWQEAQRASIRVLCVAAQLQQNSASCQHWNVDEIFLCPSLGKRIIP